MPIISTKYYTTDDTIKKEAPDSAGVYALYSQGGDLIYYGMSESSIRTRILRHNNGDEGACTKAAWFFNFERTTSPISRERELIAEYKKANSNKLPKCNEVIP